MSVLPTPPSYPPAGRSSVHRPAATDN